MSITLPPEKSATAAVLLREVHTSLLNRYFQVFCALSLFGGIAAIVVPEDADAAELLLLQVAVYFVPLFCVLLSVSSARVETDEWPLLFTQPVPRRVYVFGKFLALFSTVAATLLLLFAPPAFAVSSWASVARLYVFTIELGAVFISLGLLIGFFVHDRVQGLVLAVTAWLFLLLGIDLIALFAARWPPLQKLPDLWLAGLMLNPLDAFRIQALFAMEQIPAEAADKTPLARWWLGNAGLWFVLLCPAWAAALLFSSLRRLNRWEA